MVKKEKTKLTDQRTYFKPFNYPWAYEAWKQKLKTLYYCRSDKIAKADKVSKPIEREIIKEINLHELTEGNECLACEG